MDDRLTPPTTSAHGSTRELRVDGPHTSFIGSEVSTGRGLRRDSQLLLEASQMLQQLEVDLAEQERRDAALSAREAELNEQRTAFDRWASRMRAELEERREALLTNESALAERLSALDDRLRDVDQQRDFLEHAQADLADSRESMQAEVAAQLTAERADLLQLRQQVADDFAHLETARSDFAEQQSAAQRKLDEQLAGERQQLWTSLTTEWQQRRDAFEAERSIWDQQKSAAEQEVTQLRDRYDQALLGLEAQLANRRAAAEAELAARRDEFELALASQRSAWELKQQTALADQHKERVLLETRMRFQQEHLDKVRAELETQQQAVRHERQLSRQQSEEAVLQLERRREQLRLFQQSLDEQSASLDRERETLLKCREAWDSTVDADREALRADQTAWEEERGRQQLELQRQREALVGHSESLERKRSRLEQLRRELEDTHRTTLELRLAVEESWAQIADSVGGEEEARLRVDQARQALVLYYQELHAAITTQREDLLEQQTRFDHQRLAFHDERQTLMQWFSERDEQLRTGEMTLRHDAAEIAVREAEWRRSRDQWLSEKLEAEATIRRLLAEHQDRTSVRDATPAIAGMTTESVGPQVPTLAFEPLAKAS